MIAYGTQTGRDNALKVLLHFWPVDHQLDRLNGIQLSVCLFVCLFTSDLSYN